MPSRLAFVLGLALGLVAAAGPAAAPAAAQQPPSADTARAEPPRAAADTARAGRARPDTTRIPVSPPGARSAAQEGPGGAGPDTSSGDPVTMTARDSLVLVFNDDGRDTGTLYGNSEATYQGASVRARTIEMNFDRSELRASGPPSDSLPRPIFERSASGGASSGRTPGASGAGRSGAGRLGGGFGGGNTRFTGEVLSFNLKTKRGRVVGARTGQRTGYIEADAIKFYEDSTGFAQDGEYTTCDCPPGQTPSYSLRSDRMKVQGKWVYTGPIQLFLFNVPTPLWLPFGFLPNVEGRRSGPLPPQYGEDQRGLYLRDWGWYFALNDYTDLQLRAGIWSQGSFEIRPLFRYRKRYRYNGQLQLTYLREQIGEASDPDFVNRNRGQLRWNHSQELSPTASFGGDVNLVTSSDFARRNSESYDDAVRQQISSSVRYSKRWPDGGRRLSLNASQQQQLQSGEVSLTLPTLNFSQSRFKPFERSGSAGRQAWYEKITTQYTLSVRNRYDFRPRDPDELRSRGDSTLARRLEAADIDWYEALFDRRKYQLATGRDEPFNFQATHDVPLSASYRVNRYNLSISPSLRTSSEWVISSTRRTLQRDTTKTDDGAPQVREEVVERSVPGFQTRNEFSTGVGVSSELFGTFPVGAGAYQGVRHRLQPSLSFSYSPNFNDPFWGQTRVLRDASGDVVRDDRTGEPVRYNIFSGRTVRGSNERRSLSFSLNNEFETKRVRVDSTGEEQTDRIKLLDADVRSSYNFAADSLKLSDISVGARTDLFDQFQVSSSLTFSPYAFRRPRGEPDGRPFTVDRYLAADSPLRPLRLTRFRMSVSTRFQSDRSGGRRRPVSQPRASFSDAQNAGRLGPDRGASLPGRNPAAAYPNTPTGYADFGIPWSLSFDFQYSLSKPFDRVTSRNATVNTTFDFNVTPLWKVRGRTGYDFIRQELSRTQFSVFRDLGCWEMSFSWVPFGEFRSYSFNLHVKSGKLSQLLRLQLPRKGDSRLGGFGQQIGSGVGGALRGAGRR